MLRLTMSSAAATAAIILLAFSGGSASAGPKTDDRPAVVHKKDLARAQGRDAAALLLDRAAKQGQLRVIVGLDVTMLPESDIPSSQKQAQLSNLRRAQAAVAGRAMIPASQITRFDTIPYLSAFVTAGQLRALLRDSKVVSIQEDVPVELQLSESVPLINAGEVWGAGFTGSSTVVAVLDTGAEYSHRMLSAKVVAGLCRSTNRGAYRSLCPGGVTSSNLQDSGRNCSAQQSSSCFHGTHVASIALGNSASVNSAILSGVGRSAGLISGQVFSRHKNGSLSAFFTDMNSALERVYQLRNYHPIASVNMSIGTSSLYSSACDSTYPATAAVINNLHTAGIATVIASGNGSSTSGIAAPACIGKAVAVGSTTKSDAVSSFSNHHALVDLMAPGSSIYAASLGDQFKVASGTSMATPHVAGAIALLKDADVGATVDEVLQSLYKGVPVTRAGVTKQRIDVFKALEHLNTLSTSTSAAAGQ
jgi:subtilisin family serine protease